MQKSKLGTLLAAMVVGAVWKVTTVRTQNLETAKWNENVEKLKPIAWIIRITFILTM